MKKDKEMIELQRRAKATQSMNELSAFIEKTEEKKKELLVKARTAKQKNDTRNYKLASMGIANAIANKSKAEQMLLTMDIVSSMKDLSKLTTGFLDCMKYMCDELGAVAKVNKFSGVVKDFNKAMAAVQAQSDGLDMLMEDTSSSMDSFNVGFSDELQQEIDALVDNEIASEESEFDKAIEAKFERLKKENLR